MQKTDPLVARHSMDINHIIIEYILKFKYGTKKTSNFLEQVTAEFEEKIKLAGTKTLSRSAGRGMDPISGLQNYDFSVSIKRINHLALQNLSDALKRAGRH